MSKVIDSFFDSVKENPDAPVLSDCSAVSLTYLELDILSARVYRYLKEKGIGREDFVMILLPRGVLPFVVMLGVWRAGAAFVAVEEGYPEERVAFIKKDCGCRLTIDTNEWKEILKMEPLSGCEQVLEHDAAFAVYTSGSTGNPKGVLHEYGNLDIIAASVTFDVVSFGLIAPTNFVASVIGYLAILFQGCSMFVLPYSVIKNPPALIDCYVKNNI
ncbi:MAG: AMP-binding protein, partial [Oribacterium sp.]|nr:AMP-binding protein [Oribacterium sp.]